jgi:uncharacterized protein YndB with AHSA1/START domain
MMVQGATDLAVHKSVTVAASRQRAFEVFTAGMSEWWLLESHHIGDAVPEAVVIESREGGRWFERAPDGTECDWGRVLDWEPPARLRLAWHLDADWKYDPDPARATQIEVRFVAEGPASTRVELVHSGLEIHGDRAREVQAAIGSPNGWSGLLASYGEAAAAA